MFDFNAQHCFDYFCYTGYFLAGLAADEPLPVCMNRASRAAAVAVTRPGAAGSIPWKNELDRDY